MSRELEAINISGELETITITGTMTAPLVVGTTAVYSGTTANDGAVLIYSAPNPTWVTQYLILPPVEDYANALLRFRLPASRLNGSTGETLATQEWINSAPTTVSTATYDVLVTDHILHVTRTTTGTCAITIPTALITTAFRLIIKDTGGATTYNITIDAEGGELFDGEATAVINSNYSAIQLYSDGTNLFIY